MLFEHALATSLHLFLGGLFGMGYEYLLGCFIPKDPSLGFLKLFQVIAIIACGDISKSLALMLGANILLAMTKNIKGFRPICRRIVSLNY